MINPWHFATGQLTATGQPKRAIYVGHVSQIFAEKLFAMRQYSIQFDISTCL